MSSLHRAGLSVADATQTANAAAQAVKRYSTAIKLWRRSPLTVNRSDSADGVPLSSRSRYEIGRGSPARASRIAQSLLGRSPPLYSCGPSPSGRGHPKPGAPSEAVRRVEARASSFRQDPRPP